MAQQNILTVEQVIDLLTSLPNDDSDEGNARTQQSDESWTCESESSASESEESRKEERPK